ncbi:MAG: HAMP domain-containing histidine kinase [Firmicutes bacterium]|nr:HAMP domain-containing histidine kinase [Bacillota bacterium]
MNLANDKKFSFQAKTLFHLVIFNLLILVLLWFCQISIFDIYYEKYQTDNLNQIVKEINGTNYREIMLQLEAAAYENEVCITIYNQLGFMTTFNEKMPGCALSTNNITVKKMIDSFINSNNVKKTYKFVNEDRHVSAMLYAVKLENANIFMYSNLEDISDVTIVIKKQLLYISIIALIVAVLISVFLSNKMTNPITKITKKAKELGKGNYDVSFDESDIKEINDLALTLTQVKNELGKTDELRIDLMANVSHDLKTPLTMIKAYAEMIKDISYKNKDKMNEHLNIIIDETDRLTTLVNDILELSKLQSGKNQILKIEEYDLSKEIRNIVNKYQIIKETENYKIICNIPEVVVVKANKDKINQVIYNLINNAINYTGKDQTVYVNVKKVKKEYLVEIIDSGKGIKKEEIPYIWDKYYKSEKKHQRNVISTGLGLSIVKQILLEHNFKYGVKSTLKKGSTFYFYVKSK